MLCFKRAFFDFESKLTPRKIGWYLRSKMQLKPYKTRRGFVLELDRNRERLDFWKERYGITDTDIKGEDVNDVNVVEADENIIPTAQELGFSDKKSF